MTLNASYELALAAEGIKLRPCPRTKQGTYLATSITFERRPLFKVHKTAELFIETLQHYRREGHYKLHAFVVMPDHVHILITPQGITLERAMQLIEGGFSHRLGSKFPVWQKGFTDHRCRDANEFVVRKNYVLQNPLRGRLVEEPWQYPFSSAYRADDALSAKAEFFSGTKCLYDRTVALCIAISTNGVL